MWKVKIHPNRRWASMFAAAALLTLAGAAHAALFSVDSAFGPGTITRDPASGLDWLDLSVTAGQSINNILPQLAPGQRLDGFHYANDQALGQLFLDAGFATNSGVESVNPADVATATSLIALLGQTVSFTVGTDSVSESAGVLLESGLISDPNSAVFQVGSVAVRIPCSPKSAPACANWQPLPDLIFPGGVPRDQPAASFLVRTSPAVTPAPEPASLLLTASGFLLLGWIQRRRS